MNNNKQIIKKELKTNRLVIRPFLPNDLEDFHEYAKVKGVGEKAGWKHHENISETKRILIHFINTKTTYALSLKDSGKVIGSMKLEVDKNDQNAIIIGFTLSKDYWNKGFTTEAVKKTINYIFKKTKFNLIKASHFDHNMQSKRVIEKCGFTYIDKRKSEKKYITGYEIINYYILKKPKLYKLNRMLGLRKYAWN